MARVLNVSLKTSPPGLLKRVSVGVVLLGPLYLRSFVVAIRHYAPNAKGLVYLQKAVLSTQAVLNGHSHGEVDDVKPQLY